jgi:hypothetical protein
MRKLSLSVFVLACSIGVPFAYAQSTSPDLSKIADPTVWRNAGNRKATLIDEGGKKVVRLDANTGEPVVWVVGSNFTEGTIEADLRGSNTPGRSFVGIAFRGVDDTTHDAVYFRPFNFKSEERGSHAVQYISMPTYSWQKLRTDSPGKYEHAVSPVPDPDGWFHARIVVEGRQVSVFVNDAKEPSLVVTELSDRRSGLVGLWVGNNSGGDFANLRITPKR